MKNATRTLSLAIAAVIMSMNVSQGTEAEATEDAPGIYGVTAEEQDTVRRALARYTDSGLELPELRIYVHDDTAGCQGHVGLFNQDYSGNRIDLCTTLAKPGGRFVVLHELAHAYDHHSMSAATRVAYLDRAGLEVWNDADVERTERGIEMAANNIAWGLADTPLSADQAGRYTDQLELFHTLTGIDSPRYLRPSLHPLATR